LVLTFVEMLNSLEPRVEARIVLGPDFPREDARTILADSALSARVDSFVPNLPKAMAEVDVIVAMAGYNTICEIESLGKRSVLVPRIWPREEQWIRACRQQRAGVAEVIPPRELSPERLWQAIESVLSRPAPQPRQHRGAERAAAYAADLLARPSGSTLKGVMAS
jgi:predicted glycosyltransferase